MGIDTLTRGTATMEPPAYDTRAERIREECQQTVKDALDAMQDALSDCETAIECGGYDPSDWHEFDALEEAYGALKGALR